MRVFTDGACTKNGRVGAKAGYAVWFPDNQEWSESHRVPDTEAQTNNRAELYGILRAVQILEQKGYTDYDIVIYSDSKYAISCLTNWYLTWTDPKKPESKHWKTADGNEVINRDIIEDARRRLCKFKSYRFHHVRAHTGGGDDLSKQNDIVDKMAQATVLDNPPIQSPIPSHPQDELFEGCPLKILGPPIAKTEVLQWMKRHLGSLDSSIVEKYLLKAFIECCKTKDVTITKQTIQTIPMLRAETHLQIQPLRIEKVE